MRGWVTAPATALLAALISAPSQAQDAPLRALIDSEIAAAWQRESIAPAPAATDAEFLRRVYLDLAGTVPTYDETVEFLADASVDKRARLIDRLLDDPRYAQHQADVWDQILFGRNPPGYDTDKRDGIQAWLREQFASNTPYDIWVRALLRAEGNSVEQGPPVYWMQYRNQPEDASESVSQIFLGVQLQCARCHDHPYENWTQLDFYGMAAFLARLEIVSAGKKDNLTLWAIGEKSTGDVLFTGPAKQQQPGKQGEPVKPKFLLGDPLAEPPLPDGFQEVKFENDKPPPPPVFSRKDQLADWLARAENPFFARAIANRLWAQYLGRGLIHPVDNMGPANAGSHPALLDALARSMIEQRFDVKAFVRELVNSQTYQRSSAGSTGESQPQWFQHARTRPLTAEELVAAWRVVTGYDAAQAQAGTPIPPGPFQPLEGGYVLQFFGQPNNGAGDFQGGLGEHLYLNNGILRLLADSPGSLIGELSANSAAWPDRVEQLYLQIFNRPPRPDELQPMVDLLSAAGDPGVEQLRDAVWAMMTCSEFRFNH